MLAERDGSDTGNNINAQLFFTEVRCRGIPCSEYGGDLELVYMCGLHQVKKFA